MKKLRQYLLGHQFTIVTDHCSLKDLLTQVIQTPEQHMYLARLMGYDYEIQYCSGTHNQAADALSRLPKHGPSVFMLLSVPCLTFMDELHRQLETDPGYVKRKDEVMNSPTTHPDLSISGNLILHCGRI